MRVNSQVAIDDIGICVLIRSKETNITGRIKGRICHLREKYAIGIEQEAIITHNHLQGVFHIKPLFQCRRFRPIMTW